MPEVESHLIAWVGTSPGTGTFLFSGPKSESLSRASFNEAWARARRIVGVEHLHFHDLRHTGNTLAEMSDVAVFASFHTVRDEVPPGDMDSSGDVAVGSSRDEDLVGASIDPP